MIVDRFVSATAPSAQETLQQLSRRLDEFYNRPEINDYYRLAHSVNDSWLPNSYHVLVQLMATSGMSVLDLGCGSGHAMLNLRDRNIFYTGVDWSEAQIVRNRKAFGSEGTFIATSLYATGLPDDSYDLCFSFYVLEHLVWPHLFLKELVRVTRPGGWLMILCPDFRPLGRIPSLSYGRIVSPLVNKLRRGHLLDATIHLFQRAIYYPWIISRYSREKYPFLINPTPSCLRGPYYPDNDAVYLVDRDEVADAIRQLGAEDHTEDHCRLHHRQWPLPQGTALIVARKL
jgi:ubiquinone/menaquinone biosynthesis C-methylase UbiE